MEITIDLNFYLFRNTMFQMPNNSEVPGQKNMELLIG